MSQLFPVVCGSVAQKTRTRSKHQSYPMRRCLSCSSTMESCLGTECLFVVCLFLCGRESLLFLRFSFYPWILRDEMTAHWRCFRESANIDGYPLLKKKSCIPRVLAHVIRHLLRCIHRQRKENNKNTRMLS